MDRRKFIKRSLIFSSIPIIGFGAYESYILFHYPDFKYLLKSKPFIAEICETIIPRTDTPGAKDAHVEDYVINAVRMHMSRADTNEFIDGLKDLEKYCSDHFKKSFISCDANQRLNAFHKMESTELFYSFPKVKKIKRRLTGKTFSELIKDLTAIGYCTSETGATMGLRYDHIPVDFIPCTPMRKGQKSWATK